MNTGNRTKKWYKYCLDSKVLDRNGMAELRMTADEHYVIVIFKADGGIQETWSDFTTQRSDLLKMWQNWKEE